MKHLIHEDFAAQWRAQAATEGKVYQWSWFKPALENFISNALEQIGLVGELDQAVACSAFFEWVEMVAQCEAYANNRPIDHTHYICGRLLSCFLRASPLRLHEAPSAVPLRSRASPQEAWPQGFIWLSFVGTLLETYRQTLGAGPATFEVALIERHWLSFRENTAEDANRAGPFLDFFLGLEPIWEYPTVWAKRPARQDCTPSP